MFQIGKHQIGKDLFPFGLFVCEIIIHKWRGQKVSAVFFWFVGLSLLDVSSFVNWNFIDWMSQKGIFPSPFLKVFSRARFNLYVISKKQKFLMLSKYFLERCMGCMGLIESDFFRRQCNCKPDFSNIQFFHYPHD